MGKYFPSSNIFVYERNDSINTSFLLRPNLLTIEISMLLTAPNLASRPKGLVTIGFLDVIFKTFSINNYVLLFIREKS